MSRTDAHRPFDVVQLQEYGIRPFHGPRVDPDNPWTWVPGVGDEGVPWRVIGKYFPHRGDTAAARQQRRAMRRARRVQDHMLSRDPERYEDLPSTVEKINRWVLPSLW